MLELGQEMLFSLTLEAVIEGAAPLSPGLGLWCLELLCRSLP